MILGMTFVNCSLSFNTEVPIISKIMATNKNRNAFMILFFSFDGVKVKDLQDEKVTIG